MENLQAFLLIGKSDIDAIKNGQEVIIKKLDKLGKNRGDVVIPDPYITAMEFMHAVRIKRWKFNYLVGEGKIKIIKKKRKIYVPKGEVERYFLEVRD
jgi:hypothetical protein